MERRATRSHLEVTSGVAAPGAAPGAIERVSPSDVSCSVGDSHVHAVGISRRERNTWACMGPREPFYSAGLIVPVAGLSHAARCQSGLYRWWFAAAQQ